MPNLDVFRSDPFSLVSLTAAINKAPYKPMRIGELGLFRDRGITTTVVTIEEKDGRLSLIKASPRGGPAQTQGQNLRTTRAFVVPHLELEEAIYADQVQGVRAFGSESDAQSVQALSDESLLDQRSSHEVTLEHLRAGAIQGLILDADGGVIFDLFDEFGVTQQTATMSPNHAADEGDERRQECVNIQRQIEAELGAAPISGYRGFCGKDFFDDLRADLGITQTLRYGDPQALLQQQPNARVFAFGGIIWEEYRGSTGGTPFFADDEAFVLPESPGLFETYYAPADYAETVNTVGLPMYAKMIFDAELNRWVKIHTQSNPLPLCLRPRAVVKVTINS
jgi:hypothetical protein